jgi:lipopolysaccharide/colanic/teichoic acid biosynthesis glycosyltransferase
MARLLDLVVALVGLVHLAPLLGIVGLMVRISSPGPAIVRELGRRKDGTSIGVWYLRTTEVDSGRITDVGRSLRGSSLDAPPSLMNLLLGDTDLKEYFDITRQPA